MFGAGAACKAPSHGADEGVGGFNLSYCNVSGYRAGENAALYTKQIDRDDLDIYMNQVEALWVEIYAPLYKKDGITPDEIFDKLNKLYIPAEFSIFKNEKRIKKVLEWVSQIEDNDLPKLKAPDIHELVKAKEAVNFVTSVKLAYNAALIREESRTYHYREDFPFRDDVNWLKWVIIKKGEQGEMEISTEEVPIEEYPIKPERSERHPVLIEMKSMEG